MLSAAVVACRWAAKHVRGGGCDGFSAVAQLLAQAGVVSWGQASVCAAGFGILMCMSVLAGTCTSMQGACRGCGDGWGVTHIIAKCLKQKASVVKEGMPGDVLV